MSLPEAMLDADAGQKDFVAELKTASLWGDAWKRFRRNKLALIGMGFITLLILTAIFADFIAPYSITERDSGQFRAPPSSDHWFGTDIIGRDVFSRIIYGSRVSLRIGIFSTVIAMIIGILVGSFAGFVGGKTEGFIMRLIDMMLSIPYIILAIAVATVFGRSENSVILVLGLTGWLAVARIVRSTFLQLKKMEYVEAAHALGFGRFRIMYRHILPNALQPIIVFGTIAIGSTILAEAALSFLGVGPQDPTPAWGLMVSQGKGDLANAPHLTLFPGLAIALTVLAFIFIGDGLRDALDPKMKDR
ncbi:ABC transporter permease [Ilumatobacter sp.]|uniref:ABC transporter permease n=1 Tax=Ilumatobacter sp. TaxID=1967498 RepID=UPI003C346D3D